MRIVYLLLGVVLLAATGTYNLIAHLRPELMEPYHMPTNTASKILILIIGFEHSLLLFHLARRGISLPVKIRSPFQL